MKKQILVISSSPRKGGNSDVLCDEFIKGAESAGNTAEKIFLRDKKINYCTGCGICNDSGVCSQKDDMAEILPKMVAADVIVLASPIYFYTMCGQLKTFIDRCCPRYTKLTNKEFYYILTAADTAPAAIDRAVSEFQGFLDCLENPKEKGVICGVGVWKKGEVKSKSLMQETYDLGCKV